MVELHIQPFYHLLMNSIIWPIKMQHKCFTFMKSVWLLSVFCPKTDNFAPAAVYAILYFLCLFRFHVLSFFVVCTILCLCIVHCRVGFFCANSPARRVRAAYFSIPLASFPQYDIIAKQRVPIAQLDRASDSDSEGRRFESFWARQTPVNMTFAGDFAVSERAILPLIRQRGEYRPNQFISSCHGFFP